MSSSVSVRSRVPSSADGLDADDLYRKYCRFMEQGRAYVLRHHPPGRRCGEILGQCQTLPRERFEARLEALAAEPHRLEQFLELLRLV
jgi:hypothetical protein